MVLDIRPRDIPLPRVGLDGRPCDHYTSRYAAPSDSCLVVRSVCRLPVPSCCRSLIWSYGRWIVLSRCRSLRHIDIRQINVSFGRCIGLSTPLHRGSSLRRMVYRQASRSVDVICGRVYEATTGRRTDRSWGRPFVSSNGRLFGHSTIRRHDWSWPRDCDRSEWRWVGWWTSRAVTWSSGWRSDAATF
jgi:hypothetical protein